MHLTPRTEQNRVIYSLCGLLRGRIAVYRSRGPQMTELAEPVATNLPKFHVWSLAEQFAQREGFMPGDRLEPLLARLGGRLTYKNSFDAMFEDGSLYVAGPYNFEIVLSAFSGAERSRFTIAHELGHYVLHSQQGRRLIKAARIGSNRVEWEANWFASAFLMPTNDFRTSWQFYSGQLPLIAARYMVSPRAVEVRAQSLGLAAQAKG